MSENYSLLDAVLESVQVKTEEEATLIGDPVCESELVLAALEEACESPAEFADLVMEHATEMELYGIIHDADVAMEAQRNIVRLNKKSKFSAIQKRACIRLAMKADDPLYTKYAKYRALWRDTREKIFTKYGSKATREAKEIINNARRKASGMGVNTSKSISEKMDREIDRLKDKD